MSLESLNEDKMMMSNNELRRVGQLVSSLLTIAVEEKRVTCGVRPAIKALEKDSNQILFCVMPHTKDSAKHIQSVLLQAFCYEHNITIIKVDRNDILQNILGTSDCSCVLIHKRMEHILCLELELERILNSVENRRIAWPVFKLPAK